MAPHSSTLAWKISWMEETGALQSMGLLRVDMTERLHFYFSLSCTGEGNDNPLQRSCLENPRDGGAWRAAVYGVAQSQTRLKRLSSSSSSSTYSLQKYMFISFIHFLIEVSTCDHGFAPFSLQFYQFFFVQFDAVISSVYLSIFKLFQI